MFNTFKCQSSNTPLGYLHLSNYVYYNLQLCTFNTLSCAFGNTSPCYTIMCNTLLLFLFYYSPMWAKHLWCLLDSQISSHDPRRQNFEKIKVKMFLSCHHVALLKIAVVHVKGLKPEEWAYTMMHLTVWVMYHVAIVCVCRLPYYMSVTPTTVTVISVYMTVPWMPVMVI